MHDVCVDVARPSSHARGLLNSPFEAREKGDRKSKLGCGNVEIFCARLDVEAMDLDQLTHVLSREERLRARRFIYSRDRRRFIVGRAYLRYLLATRLSVPAEIIELAYGQRGKPALAPRFAGSDLRFNVSHSEEIVVYAFSRGRDVGVDIEAVREIEDADELVARFFSGRERDAYRSLEPREKALGFFNCWTRKEAFVKAIGDGLSYRLDSFDVTLTPGTPAKILRVEDQQGDDCGWCLQSFTAAPGFVAAVVSGSDE